MKMDLKGAGCKGADWIPLVQKRVQRCDFVKTVMSVFKGWDFVD
jgi:hypothetical protein